MREQAVGKVTFIFLIQIIVTFLLATEAFRDKELVKQMTAWPEDEAIVVVRFLCAVFLHMQVASEL